eukprot:jgi/Psemu1/1654/gm1.1654_g
MLTGHFYQPEPTTASPMLSPKLVIETPGVFELPKSIEPSYADSKESNKGDVSVSESHDNDNNSNGKDPFPFTLHKKQMRKQKCAHNSSKSLFDRIATSLLDKHNTRLKKGHLCVKWHSVAKARRAQEKVKRIDSGYRWKIEVVRDPTSSPPPMARTTPEKIKEADTLLNILDWMVPPIHHHSYNLSMTREYYIAQHKLPSKYQNDNHFIQDWFMGTYNQLMMTRHSPGWAKEEPMCARNFASTEYPLFPRDIEDMEASAAGPDIQLAQLWESPSTINNKTSWDSQSHENPQFVWSFLYGEKSPPPEGV